jgi:hypothetical protein
VTGGGSSAERKLIEATLPEHAEHIPLRVLHDPSGADSGGQPQDRAGRTTVRIIKSVILGIGP